MSDRPYLPSPQQAHFLNWVEHGTGSAIVVAVAGAGKTTTLCHAVNRTKGSVFFGVYNKAAADDIQAKMGKLGFTRQGVRIGTMHSAGFSAWRYVAKNVQVDGDKVRNLIRADITKFETENPARAEGLRALEGFLLKAVSLAKQNVFGFLSPIDDMHEWYDMATHFGLDEELTDDTLFALRQSEDSADTALTMAIQTAIIYLKKSIAQDYEVVDFDDMIFCPLYHNVKMWQNDVVIVDEAQDTNKARRALVRKMLRPGGRMIAVGDPRQAIYGFTGADADAMYIMQKEHSAVEMPLTITYRCPKKVVAFAQQWVNHIEAAPTAPEGEVLSFPYAKVLLKERDGNNFHYTDFQPTDAILCRNTKPLVEMAYGLIRAKVACKVEGRDIGQGLIKLATRWKGKSLAQLSANLKKWCDKEVQKWLAKGKEDKADSARDRADTLFIMIEELQKDGKQNITDLVDFITRLFGDSKPGEQPTCLTLATGHKSKGREWKRVFNLGRTKFQPSKYARQEWQKVQEDNLLYVMATRAMETYVDLVMV